MKLGPRIKLVFRASFEQPKGALNPMQLKVPGQIVVEIRPVGKHWDPYIRNSIGAFRSEEITPQGTAAVMKQQMLVYFERQATPWEAFEMNGLGETKPISMDEVWLNPKTGKYHRKIGVGPSGRIETPEPTACNPEALYEMQADDTDPNDHRKVHRKAGTK
jgi:hypothetical protein